MEISPDGHKAVDAVKIVHNIQQLLQISSVLPPAIARYLVNFSTAIGRVVILPGPEFVGGQLYQSLKLL